MGMLENEKPLDERALCWLKSSSTRDWEFLEVSGGDRIIHISPGCARVSGYEASEFLSDPGLLRRIVHPDDQGIFSDHFPGHGFLMEDEIEFRIIHKDGSTRWVNHTCKRIYDENGELLGQRGTNRDITRFKQMEAELLEARERLSGESLLLQQAQAQARNQGVRDALTGLHNRVFLMEILPGEISRAVRSHTSISIILADIDHFLQVNENYGIMPGDEYMKAVARLFSRSKRGSDVICRYDGDEFMLLMPGAAPQHAKTRAEIIRKKCEAMTVLCAGQKIKASLSLGVATWPNHGSEIEDVIKKANSALNLSKQRGRNRVTVWGE